MGKLINRIPGSCLLISRVPGSASLAMSTSVLKALPDKLDIKRHSPSILFLLDVFALSDKHQNIMCWSKYLVIE